MGIITPTPIQEQSLPHLLAGRDLVGQARTGSGKTLAFAIPMIERVNPALAAVQAVVLVPTRELAQQVADVVDAASAGRRIRVVRVFGGRAMGPMIAAVQSGPQVLIGTPGRVLDLLKQGALRFDRVVYSVLDEADEMLDRGFAPDVERILSFMPPTRQTVLFSATVPAWVQGTASKYLKDPVTVQVDTRPEDRPKIEHIIYEVPEGKKLPALRVLLDGRESETESVLVFGRTKHGVKKLARQLVALDYPAAALQGNLSQNARDQVMAEFRSGKVPILLATNVAARGLDVEHIGLVINFELPETTDLLTHRVGRTGRMGREGDAVTLIQPSDEEAWRQLARNLPVRIPRRPWTGDLPTVPAEIEAFPLYPKVERPQQRRPQPSMSSPQPAGNGRQPSAVSRQPGNGGRQNDGRQNDSRQNDSRPSGNGGNGGGNGRSERGGRTESGGRGPTRTGRDGRDERGPAPAPVAGRGATLGEHMTLRPERSAPLDPNRYRFTASDDAPVAVAAREDDHEPAGAAASGVLPAALGSQVDALLNRYRTTGSVATPNDVTLTKRGPVRPLSAVSAVAERDAAETDGPDASDTNTNGREPRRERGRSLGRVATASPAASTGGEAEAGIITRLVRAKGFGFIRDDAGNERFFHRNDVAGTDFDALEVGGAVRFTPEDEANGPRPRAVAVQPAS